MVLPWYEAIGAHLGGVHARTLLTQVLLVGAVSQLVTQLTALVATIGGVHIGEAGGVQADMGTVSGPVGEGRAEVAVESGRGVIISRSVVLLVTTIMIIIIPAASSGITTPVAAAAIVATIVPATTGVIPTTVIIPATTTGGVTIR